MDNVCISVQYNGEYLALIFVAFSEELIEYIALYICGLFLKKNTSINLNSVLLIFFSVLDTFRLHSCFYEQTFALYLYFASVFLCFLTVTVMCLPFSFLNKE